MITHEGNNYPDLQAEGYAAQFAIPFAWHFCKGKGIDVGCGKVEWKFPGAYPVDPVINGHSATSFPYEDLDYIFSSHCLEHLSDWVGVLDLWGSRIKTGGVIFLYLPHYSQTYWRPWNQRKSTQRNVPHVNILTPEYLKDYFEAREYSEVYVSGPDLNSSFYAVGVK